MRGSMMETAVLGLGAAALMLLHPPIAGTQFRAPLTPPGACVAVPSAMYRLDRTITQSSPPDPQYPFHRNDAVSMGTSRPFDLDGDSELDWLVPEPEPNDCVQDFHFALYLSRGACGHRLGVVFGTVDITSLASAPRHAGLPDLTTVTERQRQPDPRVPAELVRQTRTYRFDGARYRETHRAETTSVCHHCPDQRCVSTRMPP